MDFELSQEQESFRKVVADFAESEIRPYVAKWDEEKIFPLDVVKKMGEMGLFGLIFPEEYGGSGADFTTLCIAIEELAKVDSSVAITLSAGVGLGASPIYHFGSDEQKATWLPKLCSGEILGAFGLTEPDGGSDAGSTTTKAEKVGEDEWLINGAKAYITNSGTEITGFIVVTADTEEGVTAFLVPYGTPGLVVEPPYRKIGWHASDTHGVVLQDVRVTSDSIVGTIGKGFAQFLATLDEGRIAIAALALGLIQGCRDESVSYAQSRHAFGGPIGRYQGVSFKCADMDVDVEVVRNLVYKAAWLRDSGRPFKREAAIAKLYSSEAAMRAAKDAVQIFGGAGYMDETPVARYYRDAKILEIGEGTSEVQRVVLSRMLGL
ncbi:Acyl-CoA dehydrogenase [Ferrithrix thermotolerans DSM 19514]|uniref:Acyl-CoA dehydrogenase n=1 Tax=Ferrithrix thermotolerans DSM 19514 TaxID=1121881 RepID=A0A1M4V6B2_9ACTN|nr:acyl-CoA dehydrogenase family protein [Ferrithrix thermotolerans]SHE64479.1 Acyl-CoA dehydrogenase [Ferrithrix thermotolerans DSM 19514]